MMFAIIVDGEMKGLCDSPNYVKRKNDVWINGTAEDHEAVAIGGVAYEHAIVRELDGAEYVFGVDNIVTESVGNINDIQDALVELAELLVGE